MKTIAIIGYGARAEFVFTRFLLGLKDRAQIVAVVDQKPQRLEKAREIIGLQEEMCFSNIDDFIAQGKIADAVIVASSDAAHFEHAQKALAAGYHLYLEKPMSPNLDECLALGNLARESKLITAVCHEMRVSDAYKEIKALLNSGVIGTPVHISQVENVAYWHQAHSFTRGNWNNAETSAPMILAKCCHDIDLIIWLMDKNTPKRLSSFGSLRVFRKDMAPKGHADNCLNGCEAKADCPYDSEKYYLKKGIPDSAPQYVKEAPNLVCVITDEQTEEGITEVLRTGPYGKCVYECDNDVVDHQTLNLEFADGMTAQLLMIGPCAREGRQTRIMGSLGEIEYQGAEEKIYVREYAKSEYVIDLRQRAKETLDEALYGHDYADKQLIDAFVGALESGEPLSSSLENSVPSHVIALLAEKSRLNKGCVQELSEWIP